MDSLDRIELMKKCLKYGIIIGIIVIVCFIVLKGCGGKSYNALESQVESSALNYIKENNIAVVGEQYIELSQLPEIEGTELCSESSGAFVKNENGKLETTAYLDCLNYKSDNVENEGKYFKLNGDSVVLLNRGEAFNDELYTLKKDANVEVSGYVGSNVGIYTLKYEAYVNNELKETLYRKVVVTSSDHTKTISGVENEYEPSLILYGKSEMTLRVGEKWVEPGYRAVDYVDGKISRQVVITGTVDTSKPRSYTITYSVANSRGNIAIKTRKVDVIKPSSNLQIELTSNSDEFSNKAVITMIVTGEHYSHAILPGNVRTPLTRATYNADHNDSYKFLVYDTYGNEYEKYITIDNLDTEAPTGSCKATVTTSATTFSVTASDNKGIFGYSYIINGKSVSEYTSNNMYSSSVIASTAKVKVKDIAGNEVTIPCEIEKKTTSIPTGRCGASDVYITINTCYGDTLIRSNVPLEEYLLGVLYAEIAPSMTTSEEYIKAFIIFARSFTLKRIGYWEGKNKPIRSCSNDQHWCDVDIGCYCNQTQEMFNQCINYSVSYSGANYTAQQCADRVTTYPGTANVYNKTFYVNNANWVGAKSATSTLIRSSWHGPVTAEKKAFYQRMIDETAGLIIYTADDKPASVGYYLCEYSKNNTIMCPNIAEKLANQGYKMEDLIEAYTQSYPDRTVGCYNR